MWLSRNKEHKDALNEGAAELQDIRQSMTMIELTPDDIILNANAAFLAVVQYHRRPAPSLILPSPAE